MTVRAVAARVLRLAPALAAVLPACVPEPDFLPPAGPPRAVAAAATFRYHAATSGPLSARSDSLTMVLLSALAEARAGQTFYREPVIEPTPPPAAKASAPREARTSGRYRAGEDPEFAARKGWPVQRPEPLPGALLPDRRIVAFYGNPLSKRMGVLGEHPVDEMLARLDQVVRAWEEADPATPVVPALHLIAVVAQAEPGPSGKYRLRMRDALIEQVHEWARSRDAILFLDVQVGASSLQEELPRLVPFLRRPDVHLGIDPEFSMKDGTPPGKKIGTFDAADINYAAGLLAQVVREHDLPPKVLVVHRFTRKMVTNHQAIELRPEVQIVMHMDGWGAPFLKRDTYRDYIVAEPVEFTGWKNFFHNDTRAGHPLTTPEDILRLRPVPVYIQYQ